MLFGWILDWMVERAMPPDIEDPAHERIAEEAAENGIRLTARLAGVAGFILVGVIAAGLYMVIPGQRISREWSEERVAARQPNAEVDDNLRQSGEDLQGKLDDLTQERITLQGKVTDLEGQVVALNRKLQAEKPVAEPKDTLEQDALQRKVTDLEGQVAELHKTLQAAKDPAAPEDTLRPSKHATGSPPRTPILASRPSTYRCGDGRTVRNPAACNPAHAAAPGVLATPPSTYRCGDGRTVRNPAACTPAHAAAPGR